MSLAPRISSLKFSASRRTVSSYRNLGQNKPTSNYHRKLQKLKRLLGMFYARKMQSMGINHNIAFHNYCQHSNKWARGCWKWWTKNLQEKNILSFRCIRNNKLNLSFHMGICKKMLLPIYPYLNKKNKLFNKTKKEKLMLNLIEENKKE